MEKIIDYEDEIKSLELLKNEILESGNIKNISYLASIYKKINDLKLKQISKKKC